MASKKVVVKRQLHPIFFDIQDAKESGNGAVVYVPKRFIGRKVYVLIEKEDGDSSQV